MNIFSKYIPSMLPYVKLILPIFSKWLVRDTETNYPDSSGVEKLKIHIQKVQQMAQILGAADLFDEQKVIKQADRDVAEMNKEKKTTRE